MERKHIVTISVVGIVIIVFLGLVYYINDNSGVNPPFTVVESQSMQHIDDKSELGIIDTGDMIYVQSPDKCDIISYVDGYKTGYKTFGDYGSVIVYKRDSGNPVIHRAILEVQWNNDHWDIESLQNYDPDLWDIDGTHNCTGITSGTLHFKIRNNYHNKDCTIEFDGTNSLYHQSGYITLGDNNESFDQSSGIMPRQPITKEMIKSVASTEIPWLGCLKLLVNGKEDRIEAHAPNSIECLEILFISIILIIVSLSFVFDEINVYRISRKF